MLSAALERGLFLWIKRNGITAGLSMAHTYIYVYPEMKILLIFIGIRNFKPCH